MALLAVAFPIPSDKLEDWKKFMDEIKTTRNAEWKQARKNIGVRDRTFLETTPQGSMVIITLEGNNPEEAFSKFGQGTDEFTNWFVEKIKEIHGMDMRQPLPGPLPELMVDSDA